MFGCSFWKLLFDQKKLVKRKKTKFRKQEQFQITPKWYALCFQEQFQKVGTKHALNDWELVEIEEVHNLQERIPKGQEENKVVG